MLGASCLLPLARESRWENRKLPECGGRPALPSAPSSATGRQSSRAAPARDRPLLQSRFACRFAAVRVPRGPPHPQLAAARFAAETGSPAALARLAARRGGVRVHG